MNPIQKRVLQIGFAKTQQRTYRHRIHQSRQRQRHRGFFFELFQEYSNFECIAVFEGMFFWAGYVFGESLEQFVLWL